MMEMLKKGIQSQPQDSTSATVSDQESYGYIGSQGSPTPAETASPKSYSQHSPSLPASGLTEFKGVDSLTWDVPSDKPQDPLVPKDPGLDMAGTSPKQYIGVRVKMPVRELLRKMRLSKAIDAGNPKETSAQADLKGISRRTGRKRAYIEKRPKQSRQKTCAALRSVEELDILVEVLQKDLCESHCNPESKVCPSNLYGASPELPLLRWEASGGPQSDGKRLEGGWDSLKFPRESFPGSLLNTKPKDGYGSAVPVTRQLMDPTKTPFSSCMEERHWPGGHGVVPSMGHFGEVKPCCHNSLGHAASEVLEGDTSALQENWEWLKPSTGSFSGQNTSVVSFFQFQLHQEESWLRGLSEDKLLAPYKNGNRLHEAVMQGKRALAYALARRFALLNRIDEKNRAKQTALHVAVQKNHHLIAGDLLSLGANVNARDGLQKTALHLCAEKGHLRVLEVLRNYQERGTHIEVDALDSRGLTPLQCAACVHSALLMENSDLTPELQKSLNLRKDQILSSIKCLLQMGASPWVESTKASIQASGYFEKIQKDHELLLLLQTHQAKWQEDSGLLPDPNGMDLPHLQREDLDPPLVLLSNFFNSFSDGDFQGLIDPFPEGTM